MPSALRTQSRGAGCTVVAPAWCASARMHHVPAQVWLPFEVCIHVAGGTCTYCCTQSFAANIVGLEDLENGRQLLMHPLLP